MIDITYPSTRSSMSPRKNILRELSRSNPSRTFLRPSSIPGFRRAPEKYQKAVNELLGERLVEGWKDDEGHMTIAINEHRRRDVDRELRPVWTRPAVLITSAAAAAILGLLIV